MTYATYMEWNADWETHLRIDAAIGDAPVDGLLVHASGPSESGTRSLDIWESKEHSTRCFTERIAPALASLGIESGPPLAMSDFEVEIWKSSPA